MRNLAFIASGAALCLAIQFGILAARAYTHQLEFVTNHDFPRLEITPMFEDGAKPVVLRQGESKRLPYGEYRVAIPSKETSFELFKNNRGSCDIYASGDAVIAVINQNATIFGGH